VINARMENFNTHVESYTSIPAYISAFASMEDLLEISETITVIDLADGGTFIADSDNISDEHLPLVISFFSTLAMFSKQVKGDKAVDKDFNRGIGRIQKKHSPRESHQI